MASDNAMKIKIDADASGFRAGAQEAEGHLQTLTDKLREHKTEMVQEGRFARFYANEIANLGLVSGDTAAAMAHLIAAFSFGGGIGVAIASVKILAEEFRKSGEEIKKFTDDAMKSVVDLQKRVDEYITSLRKQTEAQKIQHDVIDKLRSTEKAQIADLTAKTDALAEIQDKMNRAEEAHSGAAIAVIKPLLQAKAKLVEEATKQLETTRLQIELDEHQASRAKVATDLDTQRKLVAEHITENIELRTQMLDAEHTVTTELWAKDVERQQVAFDTAEALRAEQVAQRDMLRDAENIVDAEHAAADAVRIAAEAAADEAKEMAEAKAEAKKLATELGHAALQMGEAAGDAFKGMIEGTKSVEDSLRDLLVQMVEVALRFAALRELASGDFIGAAVLGAGSVIAGAFGSGGGGSTHLTVNNTNNFSGTQSEHSVSLTMERVMVDAYNRARSRGRLP